MKNTITIYLFIFVNQFVYSQNYDISTPKFKQYHYTYYHWNDSISENQKEYWDNNVLKVEYIDLDNQKKLRKEYFENGRLKREAEVVQAFSIDTFVTFNPETMEENIRVKKGFKDFYAGKYIEYEDYQDNRIITKGQFKNSIYSGKWEAIVFGQTSFKIIEGKFNKYGYLENYYEYNINKDGSKGNLLVKGKYKTFKIEKYIFNNISQKNEKVKKFLNRPIGKWIYYDDNKNVRLIIRYKWKRLLYSGESYKAN